MHYLDYLVWPFYFISQNSIKICGIQEAARNKQEQHINKYIKNFMCESCSNFLVAETTSLCVLATPCSTTSTPRLITLEGGKKI